MSRRNGSALGVYGLAAWVLLASPAVADAHAVGVEARLKDGRVIVEAFYDDDTAAGDARVVVTDPDGKVAVEGKTDKDGKWSFPAPPAGKYKVTVDAGAGHRAAVSLTIPAAPPTPAPGEQAADSGPVSSPSIATDGELTVSEGPTRSEFTGWRRFAWAAAGLAVIGGGTWALTRLLRAAKGNPRPENGT